MELDPQAYKEAMSSPYNSFRKEATDDEMDSIMGNGTWKLAGLPPELCLKLRRTSMVQFLSLRQDL